MLCGEARGLGAGGRSYLVVDGAEVGVDGARAYEELLGNLGVDQSPEVVVLQVPEPRLLTRPF